MQIWKYSLSPGSNILELQEGAIILDIQVQNLAPVLWALGRPYAAKEKRLIHLYGTGESMPDNPGKHISTFQYYDRVWYAWHAFEQEL